MGATVTITSRQTGNAVSVYSTEASLTPVAALTTDANGLVNGSGINGLWIAEGSYNMTISGGTPAIASFTEPFEAVYGAGVGNVAVNAIGSSQIQAGGVGTAQIAANAVTAAQIAPNAVTSTGIANGAVTLSDLNAGLPLLIVPGAGAQASIQHAQVSGQIGINARQFGYNPGGISFATACLFSWVGGFACFTDSGFTNEMSPAGFACWCTPSGGGITLYVSNFTGVDLIWPKMQIFAIGY